MALITIDTNIIIHALAGNADAVKSIEGNECITSFIVVIELLSWKEISSQSKLVNDFLLQCIIKDNEPALQQTVIQVRLKYGLKIPDAFVAATAMIYKLPLVTGDPVFKRIKELDLFFIEF